MSSHERSVEVIMRIDATEAGEAAIDRYVGLTPEQGRELYTAPGLTREQVEVALIRVALLTGHDDASRFDGWADLAPGELTVSIDTIQEMW